MNKKKQKPDMRAANIFAGIMIVLGLIFTYRIMMPTAEERERHQSYIDQKQAEKDTRESARAKTEAKRERIGRKSEAYVYSQHFASQKLQYPAEANFSWSAERAVYNTSKGVWDIKGSGTTKNRYGVKLQFSYTAMMRKGDGGWHCVNIDLTEGR